MKRIVLDLQCAMFADAITMALESCDPDFRIVRVDAPDKTATLCKSSLAYALIMEVTGYTPWRLEERLRLRDEAKRLRLDCKVLLLVDENADRALVANVLQAKKDGLTTSSMPRSLRRIWPRCSIRSKRMFLRRKL